MNRFDSKASFVNTSKYVLNERNMNRCYYYTYFCTTVRCSICVTDETYIWHHNA